MQMSEQPGKSRVQFEHPHDDRCGPRVGRPGAKRNLGQMGGYQGYLQIGKSIQLYHAGVGLLPATNCIFISMGNKSYHHDPWLQIVVSNQLCCQQLS